VTHLVIVAAGRQYRQWPGQAIHYVAEAGVAWFAAYLSGHVGAAVKASVVANYDAGTQLKLLSNLCTPKIASPLLPVG